jgi:hypothetical protein
MRVAGGRTTDEEIRKAARDRVEKHRAKKKLPRPKLTPVEPSVTKPDVTERGLSDDALSRRYLAEFTTACRMWLPRITVEADRQKARLLVAELLTGNNKARAA